MIHVAPTPRLRDIPQLSLTRPSGGYRMREYEIVDTNADNIGGCSFCGYKSGKNEGHRRKLDWLKKRYAEGLRFKVLRSREFGDIGMIEYAPGSHAWRPVEAEGYLVIHCLMVNGKHKGKGLGALLLDSCLKDAKKNKCRGVAVVTSSDSFMAERERVLKRYKKGLTILAADQCPMVPKCVEDISQAARALGLKPKVVRVRSAKASRELPTPYGMFSIIYDGRLIVERPVSGTRFTNIMLKRGTQRGMPIGVRSAQGDSRT